MKDKARYMAINTKVKSECCDKPIIDNGDCFACTECLAVTFIHREERKMTKEEQDEIYANSAFLMGIDYGRKGYVKVERVKEVLEKHLRVDNIGLNLDKLTKEMLKDN